MSRGGALRLPREMLHVVVIGEGFEWAYPMPKVRQASGHVEPGFLEAW